MEKRTLPPTRDGVPMSDTPEARLDAPCSDSEAGSPPWSEVERLITKAEP
jgi:hypothetical protein